MLFIGPSDPVTVTSATLGEAVANYNEYHRPMATATVMEIDTDGFAVRFEGPFCRMCCDYDYFEDLIYELPDYERETLEIAAINYVGDETFTVEYACRS